MDVTGRIYSSPLFLLEPLVEAPHAFWSRAQVRALMFTLMDGATQLRELDPELRMHIATCAKDADDDAVLAAWLRPLRELSPLPAHDAELAEALYAFANTALVHADLELSAQAIEAGLRMDAGHPGLRLMELELRYRDGEIDVDEALFQLSSRAWPSSRRLEEARERMSALIRSA